MTKEFKITYAALSLIIAIFDIAAQGRYVMLAAVLIGPAIVFALTYAGMKFYEK